MASTDAGSVGSITTGGSRQHPVTGSTDTGYTGSVGTIPI